MIQETCKSRQKWNNVKFNLWIIQKNINITEIVQHVANDCSGNNY